MCIDVDNVIARTDEVMRAVIRLNSKQRVELEYEDVTHFDYWRCVDRLGRRVDRAEWEGIHLEFTVNHLARVQPFEGVATHLGTLASRFELHLATSRLRPGHKTTREWLALHGIPFDRLHFVAHRKKHEIPVRFVAAIDDDREQAEDFAELGVRAFVLAHPWNVLAADSRVVRVAGWPNLVSTVIGAVA